MPSKNGETQQKLARVIDMMDEDVELSPQMFYYMQPDHPSVIRKAMKRLADKGVLTEVSDSSAKSKVYKKGEIVLDISTSSFPFGLITEGVFADLYKRPATIPKGREVLLLTGDFQDS